MTPPDDLSRRRVLTLALAAIPGTMLAATTSGCAGTPANDRMLSFRSLDEALRELDRLTQPEPLAPATEWDWATTLNHCAQSIEFSMTGFPQARSRLFQLTAGATALKIFSWRGRMTHDLGEAIPGAPLLSRNADTTAAIARLKRAAQDFAQWTEPLQPHFAYGELTRKEYEQAHAMHLADHFSAFQQKA